MDSWSDGVTIYTVGELGHYGMGFFAILDTVSEDNATVSEDIATVSDDKMHMNTTNLPYLR